MDGDICRAGCVSIVSGVGADWGCRCIRVSGEKGGDTGGEGWLESGEGMFPALVGQVTPCVYIILWRCFAQGSTTPVCTTDTSAATLEG